MNRYTMTRYYLTAPGLGDAARIAPDVAPRFASSDAAAWRAFAHERRIIRKAYRALGIPVRPGDLTIIRERDAQLLGLL